MTTTHAFDIKRLARDAGFDLVRIAKAGPMHRERARYLEWIARGRQGEMRWMTAERAEKSSDPVHVMPAARSVLSVAATYPVEPRPRDAANRGRIARYAWGRDYHASVGQKLQRFSSALENAFGGEHRWYVDTGPQMDKALAVRAGLGWYGRNTNILTNEFGSFVVLGEIITSLTLPPDRPLERDCGHCRLCVTACPTGALLGDYTMDARRCISYLTIEYRGPIPYDLRDAIGGWVFGCDICQDVCPPSMMRFLTSAEERREWSREVRGMVQAARGESGQTTIDDESNSDFTGRDARRAVDLLWLLHISHSEYVEAFRGTAIRRAKVWMLRRNAAVALGNVGSRDSVPHLKHALQFDEHPIVRGHAAWALAKLGRRYPDVEVLGVLQEGLRTEKDEGVRTEIESALH